MRPNIAEKTMQFATSQSSVVPSNNLGDENSSENSLTQGPAPSGRGPPQRKQACANLIFILVCCQDGSGTGSKSNASAM